MREGDHREKCAIILKMMDRMWDSRRWLLKRHLKQETGHAIFMGRTSQGKGAQIRTVLHIEMF